VFKNQAYFGGGIAAGGRFGHLSLSHVTIADNEAVQGGGIWLDDGSYRIDDTVVSRNRADEGGGIRLTHAVLYLTGGEISRNVATAEGGGLFLAGNAAYLDRVRVFKNVAQNVGGIYADLPIIDLSATEVSGNSASDNGGGLHFPAPFCGVDLRSGVSRGVERPQG
jgi:hypothetical protein